VTFNEAIAGIVGWVASVFERVVLAFVHVSEALKGGAWGEIVIEDAAIILAVVICVMGVGGTLFGTLFDTWDDWVERRSERRAEAKKRK